MEGKLSHTIHLTVHLDRIWLHAAAHAPSMRRLEAFLNCFPGVDLTLFTARSLPSALEQLEQVSDILPKHWVTQDGAVMHHRTDSGTWIEDKNYAEALACIQNQGEGGFPPDDSVGSSSFSIGERQAIALGFLEAQWNAPRPLVVIGNPEEDLILLKIADYPLLTHSGSLDHELHKTFRIDPGPGMGKDILGILLAITRGGSLDPWKTNEGREPVEQGVMPFSSKKFSVPKQPSQGGNHDLQSSRRSGLLGLV
jgi:hypothetical protein